MTYSNGLRSATAETDVFELEPAGATVRILQPADGASVPGEAPLLLEAMVDVREDPSVARTLPGEPERLRWLVDGEQRARGVVASVDRLEPGRHDVTAVYRGDDGPVEAAVIVEVREPEGPTAQEWPQWEARSR